MADKTDKQVLCPQAFAHPPVYEALPAGTAVEMGRRVKLPNGMLVRIKEPIQMPDGSLALLSDPFEMPDGSKLRIPVSVELPAGTQIELPQPAQGVRHEADLVDLPADYCEKRWDRPDMDAHPRVQCMTCGATFKKAAFAEYLNRQ